MADGEQGPGFVVEAPIGPQTGTTSRATLPQQANQAWYVLVAYFGYYNVSLVPGVSSTTKTSDFVITSTYRKPDASKDWAARKLLTGASKGRYMTIVPHP